MTPDELLVIGRAHRRCTAIPIEVPLVDKPDALSRIGGSPRLQLGGQWPRSAGTNRPMLFAAELHLQDVERALPVGVDGVVQLFAAEFPLDQDTDSELLVHPDGSTSVEMDCRLRSDDQGSPTAGRIDSPGGRRLRGRAISSWRFMDEYPGMSDFETRPDLFGEEWAMPEQGRTLAAYSKLAGENAGVMGNKVGGWVGNGHLPAAPRCDCCGEYMFPLLQLETGDEAYAWWSEATLLLFWCPTCPESYQNRLWRD